MTDEEKAVLFRLLLVLFEEATGGQYSVTDLDLKSKAEELALRAEDNCR